MFGLGYDWVMPNKPISDERLDHPLNFVATATMARQVIAIANQRGVSYATACRWAVDFWLDAGAPVPSPKPVNDQPKEADK